MYTKKGRGATTCTENTLTQALNRRNSQREPSSAEENSVPSQLLDLWSLQLNARVVLASPIERNLRPIGC